MANDKKNQDKPSTPEQAGIDPDAVPAPNFVQYMVHDPEKFVTNFARVVEEAGKAASAYLKPRENGKADNSTETVNQMVRTFGQIGEYWTSDPQRALDAQSRLWGRYIDLWGQSVRKMAGAHENDIEPPSQTDKRFKDPEWETNPFFDFVKQLYLITSNWAHDMVDEADEVDEHTRHKAQFYLDQIVNAISPSNYVITNPELLRETMQNDGENLIKGMRMLAEDIQAGGGDLVIRQSDNSVFELGKNIAVTEGKVVAQNDLCQLIQYEAKTDKVLKTPLLICPPWINKFYILDLNEKKSFIKWCVEQGHTVFVISWANPDEKLKDKDFFDYIQEGVLFSLDAIQQATGERKVNAIGYCVGGTLLATAMAYMASKRTSRIATCTFFTTQVDFTHAGDLKVFVDEDQLVELEEQMNRVGYLDGKSMAGAFNMLRSNDLIWPYFINNYMRGKEPFPFDLLYWNSDSTRMTAANHAFYLRNCYLNNSLAKGEMEIDGCKMDLGKIKVPIYNLAAKEDHIAPAQSVFLGSKLFGGPVDFVLSGSGHIAGIVNPPDKQKYQFWRGGPTEGTFEDWKDKAIETAGSWWPDWQKWIEDHGKAQVDARAIGGTNLEPIEDAPGSYVKKRY
ncbi:PHA/PHB synthase family protein [Cohaesibacter celericrescens]|uniref:PHA/PHB synthase family protein n=1 Tax=Cohaesibacter celericrescens TaxID=2067669 RepID=UPI0035690FC9